MTRGRSGLDALLDPRSIAVVGASDDPGKIGGRLLRLLVEYGFAGKVLAVNPTREMVQGLPALRSADQLPDGVDLALVVTAADAAPAAVAACARRGVRACAVLSSGFGELGGEGERVQREMVATARAHGMRLLGPNCQGLANLASGAVTSFSSSFLNFPLRDGALAIVSQSGAVAGMLAALAHGHTGVRFWVATGNEADVTVAELIDAVLDDPAVRVVQAYCEHLVDVPRVAAAAAKARRSGKAVLMVKAGATEAGARAAGSHTGALAQPDAVVEAFLRRHGVVRARSLTELSELSRLFATAAPVRGNRMAIVSNSGGLGVMMADSGVAAGLELAELVEPTLARLRAVLPSFAATGNPVDVTGQIVQQPHLLSEVLPVLAADPGVDIVLVALGIVGPTYAVDTIAEEVAAVCAEAAGRGVLVAAASVGGRPELGDRLTARGVPTFVDDAVCTRAVARFAEHCAWLRRPRPPTVSTGDPPLPDAPAGGGFLSEHAGKALMERWGLPVVPGRLVADPAAAAAVDLDHPLVVKLCSPAAAHKTELGAVRLGLDDGAAVERAATEVLAAGQRAGVEPVEGVLVETMVTGGVEVAVGGVWDPVFGPTVLVGSGGVLVETLRDFQLLVPPLDRADVIAAVHALAVYPRLARARGAEPLDVDALVELVLRFAERFAATGGALPEIDLNPVFVLAEGVVVADALVRTAVRGA